MSPYHVNDAVAHVSHGEEFDTGLCRVAGKGLQLQARLRIRDAFGALRLAHRRGVVIGHRQRQVRPPDLAAGASSLNEARCDGGRYVGATMSVFAKGTR
jgi:hypothetical protein